MHSSALQSSIVNVKGCLSRDISPCLSACSLLMDKGKPNDRNDLASLEDVRRYAGSRNAVLGSGATKPERFSIRKMGNAAASVNRILDTPEKRGGYGVRRGVNEDVRNGKRARIAEPIPRVLQSARANQGVRLQR